jgi:putative ABC transport system ATP-binding protein
MLARMGLAGKERRLPGQLSGGEQGRVAVARALVNDPPLLLADEPTGSLDSATGEQVLSLFRELHRQGQTIVMVTHNPEAAAYADRIVHIRDGQIAPWD